MVVVLLTRKTGKVVFEITYLLFIDIYSLYKELRKLLCLILSIGNLTFFFIW